MLFHCLFSSLIECTSDEDEKDSVHSEDDPKTPEPNDLNRRLHSPGSPETKDVIKDSMTDVTKDNAIHRASVLKPTAFAPGRFSNLEILERVFPSHRRSVLELVLQGCNGDLAKAIEQFVSAQDTIDAHSKIEPSQKSAVRYNPYPSPASWIQGSNSTYGTNVPNALDLKSAFKPFPMPGLAGLHSAFLPGYPTLSSASPLSTSFSAGQYSTATFGLPLPHGTYSGMHGYTGLFNSPFSLLPYRAGEPRDLTKLSSREQLSVVDKKQ